MILKGNFASAILLVLLVSAQASVYSEFYHIQQVCPDVYGTVLQLYTARSLTDCAASCTQTTACQSFVYNVTSFECELNTVTSSTLTSGCINHVTYGEVTLSTNGTNTLPPTLPPMTSPTTSLPTSTGSSTSVPTTLPPMTSPTTSLPTSTGSSTSVPTPSAPLTSPAFQSSSTSYMEMSDIGEPCIVSLDCADPWSDCISGKCVCSAGYVFDTSLAQCVFITTCGTYGGRFQHHPGYKYNAISDQSVAAVSLAECLSACIDNPGLLCRLAVYYGLEQSCQLFKLESVTTATFLTYHILQDGYDVFQRDCALPPPMFGNACTSDDQCWESDTECLGGFCKCKPDVSFAPDKQACIPVCPLYSGAFTKYMDQTIVDFQFYTTLGATSTTACRDLCRDDTVSKCLAAIFDATPQTCRLSMHPVDMYSGGDFEHLTGSTLLVRNCEPTKSVLEQRYCWNSGCSTVDSECRDGVCKCLTGFRYSQIDDFCYNGCIGPVGTTFQVIRDLYLDGVYEITVPMGTGNMEEECKVACVKEKGIVCMMATLDTTLGSCRLWSGDLMAYSQNQLLYAPKYISFTRDCFTN